MPAQALAQRVAPAPIQAFSSAMCELQTETWSFSKCLASLLLRPTCVRQEADGVEEHSERGERGTAEARRRSRPTTTGQQDLVTK